MLVLALRGCICRLQLQVPSKSCQSLRAYWAQLCAGGRAGAFKLGLSTAHTVWREHLVEKMCNVGRG